VVAITRGIYFNFEARLRERDTHTHKERERERERERELQNFKTENIDTRVRTQNFLKWGALVCH